MIPKIFKYFDQALEMGASDLNLKPGAPAAFRVNGHLVFAEEEALVSQEMYDLFLPLIDENRQKVMRQTFDCHSLYTYRRKARIRYYLFQQRQGFAGSFRFIGQTLPGIKELNLPAELETLAAKTHGLFLVTGPAGSGKSHTVAAMVHSINRRFARHVITVESPVEFIYTPNQSIFTQIEVGTQIATWPEALTHALREDPDVLVIGELGDRQTVEQALVAAETGHLVIATLPTLGAVATLERLLSFFPPDHCEDVVGQIAMTLAGIFSQLLFPGNSHERQQGIAYELLVTNPAMRTMIRERKFSNLAAAMSLARREGCVTLKDSLARLLREENINPVPVKAMFQEIVE